VNRHFNSCKNDDDDDDNKPVWPTWAVGALFGGFRVRVLRFAGRDRALPQNSNVGDSALLKSLIQGTFVLVQGTFVLIQGTFGFIQGTVVSDSVLR
jgi:hypothetical protein